VASLECGTPDSPLCTHHSPLILILILNRRGRAHFQQLPILAAYHTGVELLHVRVIVCGHDHTSAAVADLEQEVQDLARGFRVQVPGRFVRQDQFRIVQQCPGDAYPLLFAAG
jgi:hypothetical protein